MENARQMRARSNAIAWKSLKVGIAFLLLFFVIGLFISIV
jgi:hypothetical protein